MNRVSKIVLTAAALLLNFVFLVSTAAACPTCKDGMAGDPAYSNMVNGYFWSILFMMSMPFLVFGGVSAYFYYEVCRARARQAAAATVAAAEARRETTASPEIALQS